MAKIIDTVDLVHAFHYEAQSKEGIYIRGPFQLMMNTNVIFNDYWMKDDAPFRLSDFQLNLILKGSVSGSFNLQQNEFREGDVYITHPGVLCKFHSATDDLNTRAISISGDFITERFPSFGEERGFISFRPSKEVWQKLLNYFDMIESLVDEEELVLLSSAYSAVRYGIIKGTV